MTESVLINIKIEGSENEAKIDSLSASIIQLQNENKKLAETNKALAKAEGDNSAEIAKNTSQIEINKQKISEGTASRKGLIQTITAEDNSIKSLSVRNAELIKQRNLINTSTEAGRKQIQAINAQLDSNNSKIKENSSAMEKQKMNIGNYASALDGVVPGLGGFVSGIQGATKASLAFIATPIGAIIGAIGLALATVTAYFKSGEDAQNKFARATEFVSGLLERFMNVIEDIGGFLVDNFVKGTEIVLNQLDKLATFLGINTSGIKDFFNEVSAEAKKFADLQTDIDQQDRNLLVKRAETAKAVAKLRQEALSQEGDAKRKTINEAIELERRLSEAEVDLAKKRETLAMEELRRNGDDKEAKKAVFEATAARINQEAEFYQATLRFAKEIEKLNDEEAKQKEVLNQQRAIELEQKQNLEKVNERLAEQQGLEIEETPAIVKGKINVNAAQIAVNRANSDAEKLQKKSIEIDNVKKDSLGKLSQSLAQAGKYSKDLAIASILASRFQAGAEIVSNTGIANAKAVAASPLTFGQPWVAINTISAGVSIASLIASAATSIGQITKAAGGGEFLTKGPTLLMVGDNPGGVERVSVTPISGKGQTVVGDGMIKLAGGGNVTAANEIRIASNQAIQNQATQMIPVLVLQEFEAAQFAKNYPIQKAEIL